MDCVYMWVYVCGCVCGCACVCACMGLVYGSEHGWVHVMQFLNLFLYVYGRQFDESFIQTLCSKVAQWYVSSKEGETLTLHKTNGKSSLIFFIMYVTLAVFITQRIN